MIRNVTMLMGGISAEREISLTSGAHVAAALRDLGYAVTTLDVGRDLGKLIEALHPAPDVVFNALHGRYGEDGCIQGVLDLLGIPYTHSGLLGSALAMHKPTARHLFEQAGIRCAEGGVFPREAILSGKAMDPPYVIKPLCEGSSVGVRIVLNGESSAHAGNDWSYGECALVERYIAGREISVAVMGERAIGTIEIRAQGRFYDYAAKYSDGKAEHITPAPLNNAAHNEVLRLALLAHRTLGCRGLTRSDFRYAEDEDGQGRFYILETNTQPGMTPLSLAPEIAAHAGISYGELVKWMVENASCGP
jgi:D-alanine-D-alanine ligase